MPQSKPSSQPLWPIPFTQITRVGDPVMPDRHGKPHKGRDLMAPAGTRVRAAVAGRVLRVVDGRESGKDAQVLAGLWVDVQGDDGNVYRYLHLGKVAPGIKDGAKVKAGDWLGTVAPAGSSGVFRSPPHLHFEVRASDWDRSRGERGDYGDPIEPLSILPLRPGRGSKA